jgi:hypothetical protein
MRAVAAPSPLDVPGFLQVLHRVSCTGRRGVRFREPRRRGALILVKRRLEAGMPRTNWLLAAAAVLPLLVPPSAVSYPPGLMAKEISSAKVCGAGECREVSDPEAATALAVGPTPRGTDAPSRALPWYKNTLTIPAEGGGEVDRVSVSVTVVPSAGLMRVGDGIWVTLPSESEEAYAKLTAGLTPRPARTLPSVGETLPSVGEDAKLPVARVDEVVEPPSAATPAPASDGSNVWIVALGGGVLAALMAGLLLRIRHRRASTPPAAPEAPG